MRFAVWAFVLAVVVFIASGGHILFLPLLFLLPIGGLFGDRWRNRRRW